MGSTMVDDGAVKVGYDHGVIDALSASGGGQTRMHSALCEQADLHALLRHSLRTDSFRCSFAIRSPGAFGTRR
jgi:hypothetical protein